MKEGQEPRPFNKREWLKIQDDHFQNQKMHFLILPPGDANEDDDVKNESTLGFLLRGAFKIFQQPLI